MKNQASNMYAHDKGTPGHIVKGRIKTKTAGPETDPDEGISNMPNDDKPTGDNSDSVLGGH